jgi:hypothetical protein
MPKLCQYSYADIASFADVIKKFHEHRAVNKPSEYVHHLRCLNEYSCLPSGSYSYMSFGDPEAHIIAGNKDSELAVRSLRHKETVTAESYSRFVKLCNPNMYVAPSEPIVEGIGKRRQTRAAKQGEKFAEQCALWKTELEITDSYLLAPVILPSGYAGCAAVLPQLSQIDAISGEIGLQS